ncbi:hypothetical protein Taro_013829 [Colocasia esculenta]|uniref:Uncharacterized protein n=1 Tax=Colocasia esculenta TaxID=4460 RepID=A0A843UNB5_COLES|nr:hypothetical protein [Colocasia esculenta]
MVLRRCGSQVRESRRLPVRLLVPSRTVAEQGLHHHQQCNSLSFYNSGYAPGHRERGRECERETAGTEEARDLLLFSSSSPGLRRAGNSGDSNNRNQQRQHGLRWCGPVAATGASGSSRGRGGAGQRQQQRQLGPAAAAVAAGGGHPSQRLQQGLGQQVAAAAGPSPPPSPLLLPPTVAKPGGVSDKGRVHVI